MSRTHLSYAALRTARVPVVGFAAYSGSGKTSLLTRLLPLLRRRGLRVGMVKHAHHTFEVDTPGKDSYELRKAGAQQMLVASRSRWALMVETARCDDDGAEPQLAELIARLDQASLDLILVEGFKDEQFPKIEVHRPERGLPPLFPGAPSIVAVATNGTLPVEPAIPVLDLDDAPGIVAFIVTRFLDEKTANHDRQRRPE